MEVESMYRLLRYEVPNNCEEDRHRGKIRPPGLGTLFGYTGGGNTPGGGRAV